MRLGGDHDFLHARIGGEFSVRGLVPIEFLTRHDEVCGPLARQYALLHSVHSFSEYGTYNCTSLVTLHYISRFYICIA